jgi:hypothetical protein
MEEEHSLQGESGHPRDCQTRAACGKLTAVKYKSRDVDLKNIRRHVRQVARQGLAFRAAPDNSETEDDVLFDNAVTVGMKM